MKRSIYFNGRTEARMAERPGRSLSGKVAAIIDRYSEILREDQTAVLGRFAPAELKAIRAAVAAMDASLAGDLAHNLCAQIERASLLKSEARDSLGVEIRSLTQAQVSVLVEWAENARRGK